MNEQQSLAYVSTVADALGLTLDEEQVQRVAAHLQRTAAMADLLSSAALGPHDEPAALYCPAPFPTHDMNQP